MPQFRLVARYLNVVAATGVAILACIPSSAGAATAGGEWESYNKSLDGNRFSPLAQINASNATQLKEVCRVQLARGGAFQSGPIVIDDTIFLTTPGDTIALDPTSCAIKWRHEYRRQQDPPWQVNRGVAYANGRVYRGTDDGRLIALDAKTGVEEWIDVVGDPQIGEFISGAPIAWNGLVIVGTAAGEGGIRGRIVCYDALTGREVWRFNTIPMAGERGYETWKGSNWAAHGGGGTWSTFAIDAVTGEIFIPVGNPIPDFARSERPGKNLFTNSVVVLDAASGKFKWWYQLTPDDGLDHDLGAAPMLFRNSKDEDMVAAASKDGYLYIIQRATHKLLVKTAITTVDAKPIQPTVEGIRACPGAFGGAAWNGPSFDRQRRTIFVGAIDYCSIYKTEPHTHFKTGIGQYGGSYRQVNEVATGWITAIDSDSGKVRWKFHAPSPVMGGLTSTSGGVLFAADNAGNFYALESSTGQVLTRTDVGGSVAGGVVTYEQNGRQYVALTAGNVSRTAFGAVGRPSLVVLSIDKDSSGVLANSAAANLARGRQRFGESCSICHGFDGKNIDGADLSTLHSRMSEDQVIDWLKHPLPPMPKVFVEPFDEGDLADIRDIAAYLSNWHQGSSSSRN